MTNHTPDNAEMRTIRAWSPCSCILEQELEPDPQPDPDCTDCDGRGAVVLYEPTPLEEFDF